MPPITSVKKCKLRYILDKAMPRARGNTNHLNLKFTKCKNPQKAEATDECDEGKEKVFDDSAIILKLLNKWNGLGLSKISFKILFVISIVQSRRIINGIAYFLEDLNTDKRTIMSIHNSPSSEIKLRKCAVLSKKGQYNSSTLFITNKSSAFTIDITSLHYVSIAWKSEEH